jgi:hypothetical protein
MDCNIGHDAIFLIHSEMLCFAITLYHLSPSIIGNFISSSPFLISRRGRKTKNNGRVVSSIA